MDAARGRAPRAGHHDSLLHALSHRSGSVRPRRAARARRGRGRDTPRALKATVGDEVVEIEGPDAESLLAALRELRRRPARRPDRARVPRRRRRPRDGLSTLAAPHPGLIRFTHPTADARGRVFRADAGRGARTCASAASWSSGMSVAQHRARHRRARSLADLPSEKPPLRRTGALVHVAAARRDRLQRHRARRRRVVVSGVRLSRHRRHGGAVRRHAHGDFHGLRPRVRHAPSDARPVRPGTWRCWRAGHRAHCRRHPPGRRSCSLCGPLVDQRDRRAVRSPLSARWRWAPPPAALSDCSSPRRSGRSRTSPASSTSCCSRCCS